MGNVISFPTRQFAPDTLYLVGAVTVASAIQLGSFARRVGESRRKYNIAPPKTDGDENFVRCFRAQQNCLEFYPMFIVSTWMSGMFFHQGPAAILAVYYLLEREKYFVEYSRDADARRKPFYNTITALKAQSLLAALGLFNVVIRQVSGRDLLKTISDQIRIPL